MIHTAVMITNIAVFILYVLLLAAVAILVFSNFTVVKIMLVCIRWGMPLCLIVILITMSIKAVCG